MSTPRLEKFIEDSFGVAASEGKDNVTADCFVCGKEKHLSINVTNGLCHCFVCGYNGNLAKIIYALKGCTWQAAKDEAKRITHQRGGNKITFIKGVRDALNDVLFVQRAIYDGKEILSFNDCTVPTPDLVSIQYNGIEFPYPTNKLRAAADLYMTTRGFYPADYDNVFCAYLTPLNVEDCFRVTSYNPAYGYVVMMSRAKYVPTTSYWTARRIDIPRGTPTLEYNALDKANEFSAPASTILKPLIPKSLNPKGGKPLLFGESTVTTDTPIIVEGPMDYLALRGYSVALLGKHMSSESALRFSRRFKKAYVMLDRDAVSESVEIATQLKAYGVDAKVIIYRRLDALLKSVRANECTCNDPADLRKCVDHALLDFGTCPSTQSAVPGALYTLVVRCSDAVGAGRQVRGRLGVE